MNNTTNPAATNSKGVSKWKEKPGREKLNPKNTKKFKSRIQYGIELNSPLFKIMSDYFNILYQNKKLQKEQGISVIGFYRDRLFLDDVSLYQYWGETAVLLEHKNIVFSFTYSKYKTNNKIHYTLDISSDKVTNLIDEYIFKKILNNSIKQSDLKGSYIIMKPDALFWEKKQLEERSFDDIFFPQKSHNDLQLYMDVFEDKGILMRYLMAGIPGTGKTESTLVLSNELKEKNVTIIKTPICQLLKEKVELAEILAPSIIICDDIDLSLGSRSKGGFSQNLQLFLDVLDGTDKLQKNVGIIATTNSLELLDLAAQRPGRFDKVLSFDELTKDNIRKIILKSLKYNFDINPDSKISKLLLNPKIINIFYDANVTGAHVYNSIKILKLRIDSIKKDLEINWVINELEQEVTLLDKIRNNQKLADKFKKQGSGLGFKIDSDFDNAKPCEDEDCLDECVKEDDRVKYY